MPRKYAWWNHKKTPPKTTKQTRKIAVLAKETREVQERIEHLFAGYIRKDQLEQSVTAYAESVGFTVGRRDHAYRVRVSMSGAVPMTIRELAEVDLRSVAFVAYGPMHKRGRIIHYVGIECNPYNVDSRVKAAYERLTKFISESHIRIIKTSMWDDYYKRLNDT